MMHGDADLNGPCFERRSMRALPEINFVREWVYAGLQLVDDESI
jgi:hypothetical protein